MNTPPQSFAFASLPAWFACREVIPLDDALALVVSHEAMHAVVAACREGAQATRPVLLTGETGVGKSLLARFIHASRDPYAPFVSRVMAGLDASSLLARLFGEGLSAGAARLWTEAAGGTLVLEEIGSLPRTIQHRLLMAWRAPQDAEAPALWILSTHCPMPQMQSSGHFLPTFLDACLHVHVPPLRERRQDIPAILALLARIHGAQHLTLDRLEALAEYMADYNFPGNVRELESIMTMEAYGLHWELPRGEEMPSRQARAVLQAP